MKLILSYLQFFFLIYVGFQVYSTYGEIPMGTSISGIGATILAWWAGTGLKGSFMLVLHHRKKVVFLWLSYFL